jgi:hypothetical protein
LLTVATLSSWQASWGRLLARFDWERIRSIEVLTR